MCCCPRHRLHACALTLGGLCGSSGELPELLGLCKHPGAGRSLRGGGSEVWEAWSAREALLHEPWA